MPTLLSLKNVCCSYDEQPVVQDFGFSMQPGEICSLLGPSGCGKTTVLRAIAGFESISAGEIALCGEPLSTPSSVKPPEQRQIGMVFQDYALFPHLTVRQNIGFGIIKHPQRQQRITRLLEMTNMAAFEHRYPHELSGGQQQRVALARAMATEPKLLLLDEPFSNLDTDLRRRLSFEVRQILKDQGVSAILVTHDQEEAFAFADQIGVMQQGKLLQWNTPYHIYHEPATQFVASFIGQGHFLPGQVQGKHLSTELGLINNPTPNRWPEGSPIEVLLRPDDIIIDTASTIRADIINKTFMGAITQYTLRLKTGSIIESVLSSHHDYSHSEEIGISIDAQHVVVFPAPSH
ncbi:ABC transporter ATP-binding protein [Zooshikella marina]|uniref:ABC transporter ATP-binding protein n=1 Tax=Zooshikella ganghwensis TaxID=202772 RepID=UPI001BB04888|nr:ABC transporter ATP-binding protein [Zooshikella ganghwensis]MBU2704731.1 ABC transporter ATP-binding protein [Zooshikella ganghwensis]